VSAARKALPMRALLVLVLILAASPAAAADGKALFEDACASCHLLDGPSTPSGPSLKGVVWRKIADRQDFAYTSALKSLVGSWSPDRLDAFLSNTQAFAPRTSMFFEIQDPAERRAIIAYLQTVH
jgi:cytochrome c